MLKNINLNEVRNNASKSVPRPYDFVSNIRGFEFFSDKYDPVYRNPVATPFMIPLGLAVATMVFTGEHTAILEPYQTFLNAAENNEIVALHERNNQIFYQKHDSGPSVFTTGIPTKEMSDFQAEHGLQDAFSASSLESGHEVSLLSSIFIGSFPAALMCFNNAIRTELAAIPSMKDFIKKNKPSKGPLEFDMLESLRPDSRKKLDVIPPDKIKTTFEDVAGLKATKHELEEIVDMVSKKKDYEKIGAKMPKGILMTGPPGTGKTLMARAIAGESEASFISVSGSDFDEIFVGSGSKRVRELYETAKKNQPCIVFIDEIDSVGAKRNQGAGGVGSQTINQLLHEMDGVEELENIITLAATNKPEHLDSALTRPGRFDRTVQIQLPDHKERVEIARLHLKKIRTNQSKDTIAERMGIMMLGSSGAQIANAINESAILAARKNKKVVGFSDILEGIDRMVAGIKSMQEISAKQMRETAIHEAGHCMSYWFGSRSFVTQITIEPRTSGVLGFVQAYSDETGGMSHKEDLLDRITAALGGKAAEDLFMKTTSAGVTSDLKQATSVAYQVIENFGMTKVGMLFQQEDPRTVSEKFKRERDDEARLILENMYNNCKRIMKDNEDKFWLLVDTVLEKKTMDHFEIEEVLGPVGRPTSFYTQHKEKLKKLKTQIDAEEFVEKEVEQKSDSKEESDGGVSSSNLKHAFSIREHDYGFFGIVRRSRQDPSNIKLE